MPKLNARELYFIRYKRYHVDPRPALYVLWNDQSDTWGINVHYLGGVFSKKFEFKRPMNPEATALSLARFRAHPALRVMFRVLESREFDEQPLETKAKIIKGRWPSIMRVAFRRYKTEFISVVDHVPKAAIDRLEEILETPRSERRL